MAKNKIPTNIDTADLARSSETLKTITTLYSDFAKVCVELSKIKAKTVVESLRNIKLILPDMQSIIMGLSDNMGNADTLLISMENVLNRIKIISQLSKEELVDLKNIIKFFRTFNDVLKEIDKQIAILNKLISRDFEKLYSDVFQGISNILGSFITYPHLDKNLRKIHKNTQRVSRIMKTIGSIMLITIFFSSMAVPALIATKIIGMTMKAIFRLLFFITSMSNEAVKRIFKLTLRIMLFLLIKPEGLFKRFFHVVRSILMGFLGDKKLVERIQSSRIVIRHMMRLFALFTLLLLEILPIIVLLGPVLLSLTLLNVVLKSMINIVDIISILTARNWRMIKKNTYNILKVFFVLNIIFVSIITAAILAGPALLASLALALVLKGLSFVMRLLVHFTRNVLKILPLLGVLLVLGALMTAITFMGVILTDRFKDILGFFKILLYVTGMIIGWSLMTLLLIPLSGLIITGLTLTFLVVSMMTLIGGALLLIGLMKLDVEVIKENIKCIFDISDYIVGAAFRKDDTPNTPSNKKWGKVLFQSFGKGLMNILGAIFAVAYIGLIFISIIFVILIAASLRLIQAITLDNNLIKNNIYCIFGVADMIIDLVFTDAKNKNSKESNKKWGVSLIRNVLSGLTNILGAVFAVAYMALIFIAVAFITLIAKEMLVIQKIKIDEDKIKDNLYNVFNTSDMIIGFVFSNKDRNTKKTNKTWAGGLIHRMFNGLANIVEAILAIPYMVLIFVAISFVKLIMERLKRISKFKVDSEKIMQNVRNIFETAQFVINTVFSHPQEPERQEPEKSWWRKVIDWATPDLSPILGVLRIGRILSVFATLGLISKMVENLNKIAKFKISSRLISERIDEMFDTVDVIITKISEQRSEGGVGKGIQHGLRQLIRVVKKINKCLTELEEIKVIRVIAATKGMNMFFSKLTPLIYGENNRTPLLLSITKEHIEGSKKLKKIAKNIGEMSRYIKKIKNPSAKTLSLIKYINNLGDNFTKENVDNFERYSKNVSEILVNINKIDIKKLESLETLFEKLYDITNNMKENFENLSGLLKEEISPILEKMNNSLGNVKESVIRVGSNIGNVVRSSTETVFNESDLRNMITQELPDLSESELKETIRTIYNQQKKKLREQTDILEDIKSMLRNVLDK